MADERAVPPQTAYGLCAIATCAYLFYWTFLATCLIFPVATQEFYGPTLTILPAICGLTSCALACLIDRNLAFAGRAIPARARICAGALLSLPLLVMMALTSMEIQATFAMQAIGWLLWGVAQALLFALIGVLQSNSGQPEWGTHVSPSLVASAFIGVGLLCLLSLFAPNPLRAFLPMLYLVVALFLMLLALAKEKQPAIPHAPMQKSRLLSSAKIISPFLVGSTFSMLLCYCISFFGMSETLAIVAIAALIGGVAMLSGMYFGNRPLVNSLIERCVFPLIAVSFVLLSALPDALKAIPACIAAATFFAYAIFHWSYLITVTKRNGYATMAHYSTGLISPAFGMAFGWMVSSAFALLGGDLSHPYILFFAWIAGYIVALSIAPYASDPAFEIDLLSLEQTAPSDDGEEAHDAVQNAEDRSGNTWEIACERISQEAKLSPREREIFFMLARGRNVSYISEALFISENTAKTHKYRIYRKLEASTHQELLDKVETAERVVIAEQG